MNRIALVAVLASVAAGCATTRPFPPGAVYMTVPQARPYEELGKVEGGAYAYGDIENAAMHDALDKAKRAGADAVVGMRADTSCGWWLLWFVGAIGIPPCSAHAEGLAVKWVSQKPQQPAATN